MSTAWGARANGDPSDPDSPLVEIAPGDLDAVQTCTDRIFKQWVGVQDWTDIMSVIGECFDEIDDVLGQIRNGRSIADADGVQLELVGELVDRHRGSLVDDEDYRTAIRVDGASVFFQGSHPELLTIIRSIEPDARIVRYPAPPTFAILVSNVDQGRFGLIANLFDGIAPAGVQGLLAACEADNFGWSDYESGSTDYVGGFTTTTGADAYAWSLWTSVTGI